MLASMRHETFIKHLNSKFLVRIDDSNTVEVKMVETYELKDAPQQERFSLVFRGPLEARLDQGTYSFEHNELGKFDLFIVPIRQDEAGFYYEAAFNRSISAPASRPS